MTALHWPVLKVLFTFLMIWTLWVSAAEASQPRRTDPVSANHLFQIHCAGCHAHGGNIVRRGKTLKQRALKRNGLTSIDDIAELITYGKGAMSAYGDRLTAKEIEQLATYVWQQAQAGWK
ncbi:MAG: c-type cytochrome [Leptolyngbyaceae cyanobacterium]